MRFLIVQNFVLAFSCGVASHFLGPLMWAGFAYFAVIGLWIFTLDCDCY